MSDPSNARVVADALIEINAAFRVLQDRLAKAEADAKAAQVELRAIRALMTAHPDEGTLEAAQRVIAELILDAANLGAGQ